MNTFLDFLDILIFVVLGGIHVLASVEERKVLRKSNKPKPTTTIEERRYVSQLMNTACVGGITAVSILIPAIAFVFGTLTEDERRAYEDIPFRSIIWLVLSLLLGLYVLYVIPMTGSKIDPRQHFGILFPFGWQIMAIGMGIFWTGYFAFLFLT